MKIKRICNLYCGVGGNRKNWGDEYEITAIENNPEIAAIYQDFFPNDTVIVTDAHQYLLDHYDKFDFIWSSYPCQTHSKARFWAFGGGRTKAVYPDFGLYEEIIFLKHYSKSRWAVENVDPFYKELFEPVKIGRHLFWTNFFCIG